MRILHLANVFGHKIGGGIHEVVDSLYNYQKQLGHNPQIWYINSKNGQGTEESVESLRGLTVFGNGDHGIIWNLIKLDKDRNSGFDILHQHGLWTPISWLSYKLKKHLKVKKVVQPHGLLMPYSRNLSKWKKDIAFSLFERSNINSADVLVACSKEEAILLDHLFPNKAIAVIPNGVADKFHNLEKKVKPSSRKRRLLFLSQIIPVKGLERAIWSISEIGLDKFRDWEFLIAGYGHNDYLKVLKNLVIELNLDEVIKFIGPKFGIEKAETFDNADAFILPSYSENFAIVVAEALSRGLPVLATKGAPWKELESEKCGFWVENTVSGIKEGILEILKTPIEELQTMGYRGKDLISENYLWSKNSLKTTELYEWMISGGEPPTFVNNFRI